MSQTLKDASRVLWTSNDPPAFEQINVGSLQRIADATEKMAVRHTELMAQVERLKCDRDFWRQQAEMDGKRISNLRGQITKLKNKVKKP